MTEGGASTLGPKDLGSLMWVATLSREANMSRMEELTARFAAPATITEPEWVAGRDRAVLELMLLVMFADRSSSEAERGLVREFAESRPWPMATTAEFEIEQATAAVRGAQADPAELRRLVEDLCIRIDRQEDQIFALDHLVAVAEADGTLDPLELAFLDEFRREIGLPG